MVFRVFIGLLSCAPAALAQGFPPDGAVPLGSEPVVSAPADLEQVRAEERTVLGELDSIDRELHGVRQEVDRLQEREKALESSRRRHEDEVASATAILEELRVSVATRVAALYRLHRRGLARIVFGAEDPVDLRRRSSYLLAIVEADVARLREFGAAVEAKRKALAGVDADKNALAALRTEVQLKEAGLRDARSKRLEFLEEIRTRRDLALRAMAEYARTGRELGGRLSYFPDAAPGAATPGGGPYMVPALPETTPPAPRSFRAAYGKLTWPTTGRIVRGFGQYVDPVTGMTGESNGVDIQAGFGTPVRAVFDGKVALSDFIPGYGQTVAVESQQYTHVYAHLNGVKVRVGQTVRAGDVLGSVGNTGLTDGAGYMLTFEVRYNTTPQDPLPWLAPR